MHPPYVKNPYTLPLKHYSWVQQEIETLECAAPFGLAQAPAYFQQLISIVLQECSNFAMAYLDDIIIFTRMSKRISKHIKIIFKKLKKAGLKLKEVQMLISSKKRIHYLGHLISVDGIQPLPKKLDSICDMPRPRIAKRNKTISWSDQLLQKIHSMMFWYG